MVKALTGKAELGASIGDHAVDIDAVGEYIFFNSYYGAPVTNTMMLIKPRIAFRLVKNLSVGAEDEIFLSQSRLRPSLASGTLQHSEQRLFVEWNWDQFSHEQ